MKITDIKAIQDLANCVGTDGRGWGIFVMNF